MLHPSKELPFSIQEEQRRVFWSLYLLDRLVSCGRGRPCSIPDSSCHLQLPCDELSWSNNSPISTASLSQVLDGNSPLFTVQAPFAQVVVLANLLGRTTRCMLQLADEENTPPPWDHRSEFAAAQSDLTYLEPTTPLQQALEEEMSHDGSVSDHIDHSALGPIIMSHVLFHLCHCVLHHPFLMKNRFNQISAQRRTDFFSRSSETAYTHAKKLISVIQAAREAGGSPHTSFYSYASVFAGTILALHMNGASEIFRAETAELQEANFVYLEDLSLRWNHVAAPVCRYPTQTANEVHMDANKTHLIQDSPSA